MAGKNKGGRPSVEIDWKQFDILCGIQCTLQEIAAVVSCSERTIERAVEKEQEMGFVEYYNIKKEYGTMSLRRKMYQGAMQGERVLMIWLSKQYLGMADKRELGGMDGNELKFQFEIVDSLHDKK